MALVLDPPLADEVQGLRRAVGDPGLGRIPPHVTLVPPVNVRAAELPAALQRIRQAAATRPGPLRLTFGRVATFLPVNPVLYLSVGGDLDGLRQLRDAVFAPPLERSLSWPWVPHLTLADGAAQDRIEAALGALADYAVVADIDRVVLLEEGPGRVWRPLADAGLGRPARVGTGGLAIELTAGRLIDPEIAALLGRPCDRPLSAAITARREGRAVAAGVAWLDGSGPHVGVWVSDAHRGQGIGSHVLAHLESSLRRAGWEYRSLQAEGPAGFYRRVSRWSVPAGDSVYPNGTDE